MVRPLEGTVLQNTGTNEYFVIVNPGQALAAVRKRNYTPEAIDQFHRSLEAATEAGMVTLYSPGLEELKLYADAPAIPFVSIPGDLQEYEPAHKRGIEVKLWKLHQEQHGGMLSEREKILLKRLELLTGFLKGL